MINLSRRDLIELQLRIKQSFLNRKAWNEESDGLLKEKMKVTNIRNELLPFKIVPSLLSYYYQKSNLVKILTQFNSWVMLLCQLHKNFQIVLALSATTWLSLPKKNVLSDLNQVMMK